MSKEKIFEGSSVKEVARQFASIVSQNYLEALEFWKSTALEGTEEVEYWDRKINTEPEQLRKKAYVKILEIIINNPCNQKKGIFKKDNIIRITRSSDFYDGLLSSGDVRNTVAANVEYLIDIKKLTIKKKVYPSFKRL